MNRTLIIMVKEPRPGRVKTRLARDIGSTAAAWWFRHQTRDLLRQLRDPRWRICMAVSPDREGLRSRVWPADLRRKPQGRGDLGLRMSRQLLQAPRGPVCLIGADIPGLERRHIARAFHVLGRHDFVFGPALDGGYWLVGAKRVKALPSPLFRNVRWSSEHALADTLRGLKGHSVALTDRLGDIDTAADLAAISQRRV